MTHFEIGIIADRKSTLTLPSAIPEDVSSVLKAKDSLPVIYPDADDVGTGNEVGRKFLAANVAEHDDEDDLWIIVHGRVFDLTDYVDDHPGGAAKLLKYAGKDGTDAFVRNHIGASARKAARILAKYEVGRLEAGETFVSLPATVMAAIGSILNGSVSG